MKKWEVIASVNVDDITSTEFAKVDGLDPDAACGSALGDLRGRFGDDADIHVRKINRLDCGNSAVVAEVA